MLFSFNFHTIRENKPAVKCASASKVSISSADLFFGMADINSISQSVDEASKDVVVDTKATLMESHEVAPTINVNGVIDTKDLKCGAVSQEEVKCVTVNEVTNVNLLSTTN